MYDYLIIGAGLYGAAFAYRVKQAGKKALVIDKRGHIGGNCYTEEVNQIQVHKYGAHIFHTSNQDVWEFICQFARFNHYINSPIASYQGKLYNLPFNMNTFYQLWGVTTPLEARMQIENQKAQFASGIPSNLEEQALALVGKDIYDKLIKGYSEKQWGRKATEIPAFVIKRIPLRFTFNNNYFNDCYQGIPIGGYTKLIEKMLDGIEVRLNTDYLCHRAELRALARKILFTGPIDAWFDYCLGPLQYRSLRFEHTLLEGVDNYQGNAVVNYTAAEIPYTRMIEHKHFEFGTQKDTVITKEYPCPWKEGSEPFYPVNDEFNQTLYKKYRMLADKETDVIFGGRLGAYQYYDMDKVIEKVLTLTID